MKLVNEYNTQAGGQRPVFANAEAAEEDMLEGISYACANSDGFPTANYVDLDTGKVYQMVITCKLEMVGWNTDELSSTFWDDIAEEKTWPANAKARG